MDFVKSIFIAASGLKAQNGRMRIIAENIANADSTGRTAEEELQSSGTQGRQVRKIQFS